MALEFAQDASWWHLRWELALAMPVDLTQGSAH